MQVAGAAAGEGTVGGEGEEKKSDGDDDLCSGMDWLADEAAHLERSLLRDCRRLAQVRLELQRSSSLAKELDANIARVGFQQAKVAAELARRAGANARSAQQPVEPAAVRPPASGEVVGRVVGVLHARPDPTLALARASAAQRTHTAGPAPAVPPGQPRGNNATRASAQTNSQPASADAARPGIQQSADAARPGVQQSQRTARSVGSWFPDAAELVGPLGKVKATFCNFCGKVGHDKFECPAFFFKTFNQAMPGHSQDGLKLPNYWHDNNPQNGPAGWVAEGWIQQSWLTSQTLAGSESLKPTGLGTDAWRAWANRPKGKASQAKPAAAAEEAGTEQAASRTELSKKQRKRLRQKAAEEAQAKKGHGPRLLAGLVKNFNRNLLETGGGGGGSSEKQHGPAGCNLFVYHENEKKTDGKFYEKKTDGNPDNPQECTRSGCDANSECYFSHAGKPWNADGGNARYPKSEKRDAGERGTLGDLVVAAAPERRAGGAAQPGIARVPPSAPPPKPAAAAASGQQPRALAEGQGTPKRGLAVGASNKCAWVAAPQATPQAPAQASTAPATSQASGAPPAARNSNVQQGTPDTSRATPAPAAVPAHKATAESGQQPWAQSKAGASAMLPVATEHATALTQALPPQGEEALPKAFKSVSVERSEEDAALSTRDKAAFDAAVVTSDGGGLRPGSIPTVSSLMLFKHEPAQAIEPKDWRQEEHVFGVFARVAARRPLVNKIDTVHSEALRSFCARTASIVLCECHEATASGLGPLLECRRDLVAACRTAGLEELDELKLGLAHASRQEGQGNGSGLRLDNGLCLFEIPPGYLELVEAAAAAGALRVVRSGGEWHVQRGERVGADEDWSPPAVDVSLKFGVSNQCLPVDDRDRVDETRLMFQVKVCQEEPVHREVLQKSKKPPPSNKKSTDAKIKSFWLKARGLRVGRNQIYIRLGVQAKSPRAAPSPVGAPNSPKTAVCWGPWNTSPLSVFVSLDLSAREESQENEAYDAFQNSHAAAAPAAGDRNGACPTKRKASEISSPRGAGASDGGLAACAAAAAQSPSAGCASRGVKAGKGKTPAKAPGGRGGSRSGPSSATRTTRATAAAAAATSQVTGSAGGAEKAMAGGGGAGGGGQGQGRGESGGTPARRTRSQVQGTPAATP